MKTLLTLLAIILLLGCTKEELNPPTIEQGIYSTKVILWASQPNTVIVEIDYNQQYYTVEKWEVYPPYPDQENNPPYFYVIDNIKDGVHIIRHKASEKDKWIEKGWTLSIGETKLFDVTNL